MVTLYLLPVLLVLPFSACTSDVLTFYAGSEGSQSSGSHIVALGSFGGNSGGNGDGDGSRYVVGCRFEYDMSSGQKAVEKEEEEKENKAEDGKISIEDLHKEMSGKCVNTNIDRWTYEVCFGVKIRQFVGDGSEENFNLGVFDKDLSTPGVSDYTEGDHCGAKPRTTRLFLRCDENAKRLAILSVSEPSQCEYRVIMASSRACAAGVSETNGEDYGGGASAGSASSGPVSIPFVLEVESLGTTQAVPIEQTSASKSGDDTRSSLSDSLFSYFSSNNNNNHNNNNNNNGGNLATSGFGPVFSCRVRHGEQMAFPAANLGSWKLTPFCEKQNSRSGNNRNYINGHNFDISTLSAKARKSGGDQGCSIVGHPRIENSMGNAKDSGLVKNPPGIAGVGELEIAVVKARVKK